MRLIHTADLHIDSKTSAWLSENDANARRDELLINFKRLAEAAKEMKAVGVMIAGDLFDVKYVSKKAESTVMETIASYPDIIFYYVPGNHDKGCFLTRLTECPLNLVVFNDRMKKLYLNAEGTITLSSVELTEENYRSFSKDIVLEEDCFNIVMLHGEARQQGSEHYEECLNMEELENKNIDYLALGHIHAPHMNKLKNRGVAVYSGCLEGRNFDECGDRGFIVLDINEDNMTAQYSFVPFAMRKMQEVMVFCSDCQGTEDIAKRIESVLDNTDIGSGDFLNIRLMGIVDAFCNKNADYLYKRFERRATVVKITDETEYTDEFIEFADDPGIKGEFLRLVSNAGLLEDDVFDIIRTGIGALMGEDLN